mmetsp:Transcript_113330/g.219510  ORF Transcript_113330/g.219510 Transcript_113330/m.219510 type:complete len:247 (-) Transcript_113330:13-753(-)
MDYICSSARCCHTGGIASDERSAPSRVRSHSALDEDLVFMPIQRETMEETSGNKALSLSSGTAGPSQALTTPAVQPTSPDTTRRECVGQSQPLRYGNKSAYWGQLCEEGKRNGEGVCKCSTEQYMGQWLNDMPHGHGCQTWIDGRSYSGQYEGGKLSGRGRMVWQAPTGQSIYEGEYLDSVKHGIGCYTWPDGRVYEGEWLCGKRHGRGLHKNACGTQKLGHWTNDHWTRWDEARMVEENIRFVLH